MYYNPMDEVFAWWFDKWVEVGLKMYYWPAFVAGNADNWKDIMTWNFPTTICKP